MITPTYLDPATMRAIKQALKQDPALPSVALQGFLTAQALQALEREARTGWKRTGVPDRGLYATRSKSKLQRQITAYANAIIGATTQEPNRQFSHRDFTLLHDHEEPIPGWRAYFFLDDLPAECGGQLVFVKDGETLGRTEAKRNLLLLVKQGKGVHAFVQYVNHHAGKRSVRILGC